MFGRSSIKSRGLGLGVARRGSVFSAVRRLLMAFLDIASCVSSCCEAVVTFSWDWAGNPRQNPLQLWWYVWSVQYYQDALRNTPRIVLVYAGLPSAEWRAQYNQELNKLGSHHSSMSAS